MNTNLALATSQSFGEVQCDFWQDKENESQEFYVTREQIGTALEYVKPNDAIEVIHRRHKERLDKFSTTVILTGVEGNRSVNREKTLYSSKGMYEICRWSKQPKADKFIDWVWEVIDSLRTGEARLTQNNVTYSPQAIQKMMGEYLEIFKSDFKNQLVISLDLLETHLTSNIDKRMNLISNSMQYLIKLIEQKINQIMDIEPEWKDGMFKIADKAVAQKPEKYKNSKAVLQEVYNKMRNVYSVIWEQEQREFREKHGTIGQTPTMELISDKEQLMSIFEGIIEDMVEPTKKANNIVYFPVNVEIDPIKAVIAPLINKRQDKSKGGNKTYQAVYKRMPVCWENRFSRYCKKYELKKNPSKSLIIKDNEKLFKMFKQVVSDMLKE